MNSNIFDVLRRQADAIIQARKDQPWIEREHQHHLRSQTPQSKATPAPTEQLKSRTVDG